MGDRAPDEGTLGKLVTPTIGVLSALVGVLGAVAQQEFEGAGQLLFGVSVAAATLGAALAIVGGAFGWQWVVKLAAIVLAVAVLLAGCGAAYSELKDQQTDDEREARVDKEEARAEARSATESPFLAYTFAQGELSIHLELAGQKPRSPVLAELVTMPSFRGLLAREQVSTDGLGDASVDLTLRHVRRVQGSSIFLIGRWIDSDKTAQACVQKLFEVPGRMSRERQSSSEPLPQASPCDLPRVLAGE